MMMMIVIRKEVGSPFQKTEEIKRMIQKKQQVQATCYTLLLFFCYYKVPSLQTVFCVWLLFVLLSSMKLAPVFTDGNILT